ncbi:MAG: PKD domain-containing protein [Dehalococcoidia bacterium]|nr:PKD domain-containing protein [Dehalococcoidia bacterium]
MRQFNVIGRYSLILVVLAIAVQLSCTSVDNTGNQQNHAPVIETLNYDKTTYHNRPVEIECIASDIDGDNLTYSWESAEGNITGEGKNVIWSPPGNMRNYPINLTVTDGKGGEAKEKIYIMVVTNADGTASSNIEIKLKLGDKNTVLIENQRVGIWTTANILCSVENAKGSNLIYKWSADCGRIQEMSGQDSIGNRISWIAPGAQSDCTVSVTVIDTQQGVEAKGKVNFGVFCCGKEITGD